MSLELCAIYITSARITEACIKTNRRRPLSGLRLSPSKMGWFSPPVFPLLEPLRIGCFSQPFPSPPKAGGESPYKPNKTGDFAELASPTFAAGMARRQQNPSFVGFGCVGCCLAALCPVLLWPVSTAPQSLFLALLAGGVPPVPPSQERAL